ncbi:hypothetical protein D0C36_00560 [Mucilaginibacter conchicola]|uniref:Uncharacterized protein n=1 Tax=Mucilaginibacter conchicola TaxID=2303333 RepID=A0A372NVD4_9SPHI|nr:hypothetical protein [Mucilaginibacter conchicola]RFZ94086.1 hypothetical protein D0C36_00560 [Mucilaginibacter conchicola]
MKNILTILALPLLFMAMACNNNKPAPASNDTTQTAVTVKNKKVAVINNPDKNYAKLATVPDPCIKCIIGVVQTTDEFKKLNVPANSSDIKYEINWVPAETSADTASKHISTNALKLDVINKSKSGAVLSSFVYDNTASKLFLLKDDAKTEIKADVNGLKKIRRACYWGVASAK